MWLGNGLSLVQALRALVALPVTAALLGHISQVAHNLDVLPPIHVLSISSHRLSAPPSLVVDGVMVNVGRVMHLVQP